MFSYNTCRTSLYKVCRWWGCTVVKVFRTCLRYISSLYIFHIQDLDTRARGTELNAIWLSFFKYGHGDKLNWLEIISCFYDLFQHYTNSINFQEIRGYFTPPNEVIVEDVSLPGLAELKGRWNGNLEASGGGNGDTVVDIFEVFQLDFMHTSYSILDMNYWRRLSPFPQTGPEHLTFDEQNVMST